MAFSGGAGHIAVERTPACAIGCRLTVTGCGRVHGHRRSDDVRHRIARTALRAARGSRGRPGQASALRLRRVKASRQGDTIGADTGSGAHRYGRRIERGSRTGAGRRRLAAPGLSSAPGGLGRCDVHSRGGVFPGNRGDRRIGQARGLECHHSGVRRDGGGRGARGHRMSAMVRMRAGSEHGTRIRADRRPCFRTRPGEARVSKRRNGR